MPPAALPIVFSLVTLACCLYAAARWLPATVLAALVRWLIRCFPVLSYDYRHRRIRQKQICPACANCSKVSIRCDSSTGQVVCQCRVCLACWAYNPVVKPEKWANLPKVEE